MIEMIRRRVVSGGGFGFRLFEFVYRTLANSLDDPPCSVAALAGLLRGLACLRIDLFAGPVAIRTDVLACARSASFRVVVGRMGAERIF